VSEADSFRPRGRYLRRTLTPVALLLPQLVLSAIKLRYVWIGRNLIECRAGNSASEENEFEASFILSREMEVPTHKTKGRFIALISIFPEMLLCLTSPRIHFTRCWIIMGMTEPVALVSNKRRVILCCLRSYPCCKRRIQVLLWSPLGTSFLTWIDIHCYRRLF